MYRTLRGDFAGLHDADRLSFLILLDIDESPVSPCSIQGETEEVKLAYRLLHLFASLAPAIVSHTTLLESYEYILQIGRAHV